VIDNLKHSFELSRFETIQWSAVTEQTLRTMHPYFDAFGIVHIAKLLDNVLQLKKAVTIRPFGSGCSCYPVLNRTKSDAGNIGDFTKGESLPSI